MSAARIDGKKISEQIRSELAVEVSQLKTIKGIVPGLAVVIVGENPASQVYVNSKEKACEKAGLYSVKHALNANATEGELLVLIDTLNKDSRIHGILVQLPLPGHINENKVLNAIDPDKDVDGFHPVNVGRLLIGIDGFKSCTPYGIVKLLEYSNISPSGKHVVIVGRSNIVGKPVAALLMQKGKWADATVTVAHSRTVDLPAMCRSADILIAAIGKAEFVTANMVKPGAVVIDVGINRIPDAAAPKGYKIVGDVKFDEVSEVCSAITPVPGGVGAMTIAMLLYNTVESAKRAIAR